jgi:hypothetical protein
MANQTDPLASGLSTSEGKLTIALCLVGAALEAFGAVLAERAAELPGVPWLGITSLVVGAATQVLAVLGYTRNRSALKSNALVQALASGVPLVVTAVSAAVLKNVKDKPQALAQAEAAGKAALQAAGGTEVSVKVTDTTANTRPTTEIPAQRP